MTWLAIGLDSIIISVAVVAFPSHNISPLIMELLSYVNTIAIIICFCEYGGNGI